MLTLVLDLHYLQAVAYDGLRVDYLFLFVGSFFYPSFIVIFFNKAAPVAIRLLLLTNNPNLNNNPPTEIMVLVMLHQRLSIIRLDAHITLLTAL